MLVSDTASKNPEADVSGPTAKELLNRAGWLCTHHRIVADDISDIQNTVMSWLAKNDTDLLITIGGTGFGIRDKTPEVRGAFSLLPFPDHTI